MKLGEKIGLLFIVCLFVLFIIYEPSKSPKEFVDFHFDEMGIRMSAPHDSEEIFYDYKTAPHVGRVVWASTPSLSSVSDNCSLGVFYLISKESLNDSKNMWTLDSLKDATISTDNSPATVKEFENLFFVFEPNQSVCSDGEGLILEEVRLRDELIKSVQTAVEIQKD